MRYHWLAHHLVQARFPQLNQQTRNEIVSEAVCRAWCSFSSLDYRLMQSCVEAAARRKGLCLATTAENPSHHAAPGEDRHSRSLRRGQVIRLSDYR